MNQKRLLILFLVLFSISILSTTVAFAQEDNFWDSVIGPFGEGFEEAYEKYFPFIDAIVYIIIFTGLAEWALGSRFMGGYGSGKKGGKAVVIGIGLVFALSLALWERSAGFNLKSFGPIAMAVMLAIMCFALYEGLRTALGKENINKSTAFFLAYLAFIFALVVFKVLEAIGELFPGSKPVLGILNLIGILAAVLLIFKGFRNLTGEESKAFSFGGRTPRRSSTLGSSGGAGPGTPETPHEAAEEEAQEEYEEKEIEEEEKIEENDYIFIKKASEKIQEAWQKLEWAKNPSVSWQKKKEVAEEALSDFNEGIATAEEAEKLARKAGDTAKRMLDRIKKIAEHTGERDLGNEEKRMLSVVADLDQKLKDLIEKSKKLYKGMTGSHEGDTKYMKQDEFKAIMDDFYQAEIDIKSLINIDETIRAELENAEKITRRKAAIAESRGA